MSNGNLMKYFVKEMSNMVEEQICVATDELEQTKFYTWPMRSIIWLVDDFLISCTSVFYEVHLKPLIPITIPLYNIYRLLQML